MNRYFVLVSFIVLIVLKQWANGVFLDPLATENSYFDPFDPK